MSLSVNSQKCGKAVKARPFDAGVCLMALGMNTVTKATRDEYDLRCRAYRAITGCDLPGEFTAEDMLGIETNVSREPLSRWLNRIAKFELDCRARARERVKS